MLNDLPHGRVEHALDAPLPPRVPISSTDSDDGENGSLPESDYGKQRLAEHVQATASECTRPGTDFGTEIDEMKLRSQKRKVHIELSSGTEP